MKNINSHKMFLGSEKLDSVFISETNNIKYLIFALTFLTIIIVFFLQGHVGFNLWDEGFLWYGVQRVLMGEVPIRDFMSYDPGRYYWSAVLMAGMGDSGIISLRIAVIAFYAMGLFSGIITLTYGVSKKNSFILLFAIGTMILWSFPRHKLFDVSLSIMIVSILTNLITSPIKRNFLMTGFAVGLMAFMGRNHGIYGSFGSIAVIIYLSLGRDLSYFIHNFVYWVYGVIIGYSPMIIMLIFIPDFATAVWEGIHFMIFEYKGTNLPLEIPWPWLVSFSQLSWFNYFREISIGLFFVFILLYGILGTIFVIYEKIKGRFVPPLLLASVFMSLPYSHFAYSRADIGHLAQGIFPFLIGVLAFFGMGSKKQAFFGGGILFLLSLLVMLPIHPGWQSYQNKNWIFSEISGSLIEVDPSTASHINLLRELDLKYCPNGESFIATPFWPGAYAVLHKKSPIWEIYATVPRSMEFQEAEINRIHKFRPKFAIILDISLDNREDLHYKNTHSIINQYIENHFEKINGDIRENSFLKIFRSKDEINETVS